MISASRVLGLVVLLAALLVGCATTGPAYTPMAVPQGKAIVYFYRPPAMSLKARTIFMAFPGSDASYSMVDRGYYPLVVDPGSVTVSGVGTDARPVDYTIDVRAGEERFVRVTFSKTLALVVPAEFQEVPAETGRGEITQCSLISESQ